MFHYYYSIKTGQSGRSFWPGSPSVWSETINRNFLLIVFASVRRDRLSLISSTQWDKEESASARMTSYHHLVLLLRAGKTKVYCKFTNNSQSKEKLNKRNEERQARHRPCFITQGWFSLSYWLKGKAPKTDSAVGISSGTASVSSSVQRCTPLRNRTVST